MKNPLTLLPLIVLLSTTAISEINSQCNFNISNPNPCPGEDITLTVVNPMQDSIYTWDFTTNGIINADGPSVTTSYPYSTTPATYTVTLKQNGVTCNSKSVSVKAAPDPKIGLSTALSSPNTTMSGDTIKTCGSTPNSVVAIFNNSSTFSSNSSYEINWGDGVIENFNNSTFSVTTVLTHDYSSYGFKLISVKVVHNNGCHRIRTYIYYNGSNPSVGLENPGGTVGLCAPATLTFPISGTTNNPTGTVYTITVNGNEVQTYTQGNVPSSFTYTFNETSCNETTTSGQFDNAFDLRILASNPCGSSAATIEPIELSTLPIADFIITEPVNKCPEEVWVFTDNSTNINEVISGNPTVCNDSIPPSWQITPGSNGVEWTILSGNIFASEELEVEFLVPGVYTIEMTVVSSICGPSIIPKTITVLEPPVADANAIFNSTSGCVPTTVSFNNLSSGFQVSYDWSISPSTGWGFANGSSASSENPSINFTESGSYFVTLTATNVCDTDTWDTTLTFITQPIIEFDEIPDYCLSAILNFSASNISFSSVGTPITSYAWTFLGAAPTSSSAQYPINVVYNTPGTFDVSVTAANICGTTTISQSFTVQTPTGISVPADFQVCINATPITLNASPPGGTWTGPGVTQQGVFNPPDANIGNNTLTYSFGNGLCSAESSLIATVFELPNIDTDPDLSECESVISVPLAASPAGGTWSSSPGGVLNGNTFEPAASGQGSYTLTYSFTSLDGCENSDDLVFTVFPLPLLAAEDTVYCNTQGLVPLPFASPTGGSWSGLGVFGNQFDPTGAGGVGTYTATYSYSDANGCTDSTTIEISVINPASMTAGPDTSLCLNATPYNLSQSASPTGGTWTTASSGLNGSSFDPSQAGAGTHSITYSVGAGNCLVSDQIEITVYPLPNIDTDPDLSECESVISVPLAASPAGGTWSSSPGGVLNGNTFEPAASGQGSYTLTYSFTSLDGCENSDDLVFTVFPLPLLAAEDTVYCSAQGLVPLPFASPTGGSWSGLGVFGNQFDPTGAGGVGTYTATYSYSDANGCTDSTTIEISVINPASMTAGPDTSLCLNATPYNLSQSASPTGGTWTTTSSGLNGSSFDPSQAGAGTHSITYSVGAGNCLVSDQVEITVYPLPNVDTDPDLSECESVASVQLAASPAGGTWSSSPGGVLNGNTFEPAASGQGNYTLIYTYEDSLGCINSDEMEFTVFSLPKVASNDTTYCNAPGSVDLPFSTPVGGSWSGPGTIGNIFSPFSAGGIGTYQLTYVFSDVNGCTDSTIIEVLVIEQINIEAGVDDTLCVDDGLFQLSGFSPSGGTWFGNGIIDSQQGIFDPSVVGGVTTTLTYSVGTGNCEVRDSINILVMEIDVEAGVDEEYCIDSPPIQLSGFSPPEGYWTGPGISDSLLGIFDVGDAGVGTHEIFYFIVDTLTNCVFQASKTITVHPMPQTFFEVPEEACINQSIQFINLSQNTFQTNWDFGDGTFSDLANPVHTYTIPGWYSISLSTTTEFGCTDAYSINIFITEPPIISFEPDTNEGCSVLEVNLTNNSSGYQITHFWDFGNGQTDTIQQPGAVFFEQGTSDTTYIITLTVTNQCASLSLTDTVTVFPLPIVNFGTSIDTSCSPMVVNFANLTLGDPESFLWDFGNGNTSTDSLPNSQTYYTDTVFVTYPITLIATNFCGNDTLVKNIVVTPANVDAFFNIPSDIGCQPYTVSFTNFSTLGASIFWDFGDGNTSALANPNHIFEEPGNFQVIQYASTGCGYDSTTASINVLPAPMLSFTHEPAICQGDSIQFFNTSPDQLSGTLWYLGDGDSSFLNNPFHIYQNAGEYVVSLQGTSTLNGCTSESTSEVIIWELPIAEFQPSIQDGCAPLAVSFENLSDGATYFDWFFGDGNTTVGAEPTHIFTDDGSYPIVMVGTDVNGCSDTSFLNFIQVYPDPIAEFSMERDRLCGIPVTMNANNESQGALGYNWDFGDGNSSTFVNPEHEYQYQGNYQVTLIAENTFSCKDTLRKLFNVYPIPLSEFDVVPALGCEPLKVDFLNFSTGSNRFYWSFGDFQSSSENEPSHIYAENGLYSVQLIASFDNVCFDTLTVVDLVTVLPTPIANFEYVEINQGVPVGIVQFFNLSENAFSYNWDFGDGEESSEENPIHRYYENGVWQVLLEATGSSGCKDDTLLQVSPAFFRGLFIPNAFSPEQGLGDVRLFKPKGVGLKEYKIEIFSPYGQLIWSSEQLVDGQPSAAWDGWLNGQLQPQDIYVWKAYAVFEDGTVWPGMPDKDGKPKTIGSLILLR